MTFSLGPKGGIQDPAILRLLAELTSVVKKYGYSSDETEKFIADNESMIAVDKHTQHMHTFREIAEALGPLIQGLKNISPEDHEKSDPANWWKEPES
jgi:hypothetical protein